MNALGQKFSENEHIHRTTVSAASTSNVLTKSLTNVLTKSVSVKFTDLR